MKILYLDNFNILFKNNKFKSIGQVKIKDNKNHEYEFSQIYISTQVN